MTRFGDFTLLDEIAESEVADCFEATHDVQGGPLFLKRYRRVDPTYAPALLYRCEVLMAVQHPNLAPHLGHGDVDGVVFAVSPYLEGIDLDGFIESVTQRRVVVKLETLLFIVREAARAVAALHAAAHDGQRALLAHGDVCTRHVRIGAAGEVWLTGLPTPRGLSPDRPPEALWDSAGLGALLYDLIPLTRTGGQRPSLPGPLDRVVRRTLGIGPLSEQVPPKELADRLDEVAAALKLPPLAPRLLQDAAARAIQHRKNFRSMSAADALPTLEPVIAAAAARSSAPSPELERVLEPAESDPFYETAPTERPPRLLGEISALPTEPPDRRPLGLVDDSPTDPRAAFPSSAPTDPPAPPLPSPAAPSPPAASKSAPPARARPTTPPRSSPVPAASAREPAHPKTPPRPTAAAKPDAEQDAFANQPTAPRHPALPIVEDVVAPVAEEPLFAARDLPHRAATPLDELGSLTSVPPAPVVSAPWVAAPEEPDNFAPAVRFEIADDLAIPLGDDDLPIDPFIEQTLPGHLMGSLPSDEPAAFEVELTPVTTTAKAPDSFEEHTRPDLSAMPDAPAPTPPEVPAAPVSASPAAAAVQAVDPGPQEAPKTLEVPRDISVIVKIDAPLREKLGLLADPMEQAAAEGVPAASADDDDDSSAFADSPPAAEVEADPVLAALIARGAASAADVKKAREAQQSRGGRVPEILVAMGVTTDALVADALAAEAVKPRLSDQGLLSRLPDTELCRRLPQTYALARRMLPLLLEKGQLTLAVADPFDDAGVAEVTRLCGASQVRVHVAARATLTDAVLKAYRALGARVTTGEGTPSVLLCMRDDGEIARFGARLADEGFRVAHAGDVATAKMLLDAQPPAAIVLALDVPESESLLVFACGVEADGDTPLFVTGEGGDDAAVARVLDLGADDFFERPASLNVVMAKLRRAVNKRGPLPTTSPRASSSAAAPSVAARASAPSPPPVAASRPVPSRTRPPMPAGAPPPTFDFWENSAPLDELPDDAPGDTDASPPMFAEPTGVMGTLRQMAVAEIVQSLEMGRKTARVELVPTDGQRGMLGFQDGRVVYADCGELRGEQAFYSLARHTEGFFRIRYGEAPAEKNVEGSTTFLLLEAMRLMDEEGGGDEPATDPVGAEKTPTPFD